MSSDTLAYVSKVLIEVLGTADQNVIDAVDKITVLSPSDAADAAANLPGDASPDDVAAAQRTDGMSPEELAQLQYEVQTFQIVTTTCTNITSSCGAAYNSIGNNLNQRG